MAASIGFSILLSSKTGYRISLNRDARDGRRLFRGKTPSDGRRILRGKTLSALKRTAFFRGKARSVRPRELFRGNSINFLISRSTAIIRDAETDGV